MKRTDLQRIMKRAWAIARETGKAFAVCLAKSWQLYRLTKAMRAGVVKFCYEKADGSLRKAAGTLQDVANMVKGTGHENTGRTFRYFDLEKGAFRSFKASNLIAVYQ